RTHCPRILMVQSSPPQNIMTHESVNPILDNEDVLAKLIDLYYCAQDTDENYRNISTSKDYLPITTPNEYGLQVLSLEDAQNFMHCKPCYLKGSPTGIEFSSTIFGDMSSPLDE
ncbi:hypothetical protein KI387_011960, partial [Taxus chinensis]